MTQKLATPQSILSMHGLELCIHLGWPDAERMQAQLVEVDLEIGFHSVSQACTTDNLVDTICYATLINDMRETISKKKFNLIEHLCFEIYKFIKSRLTVPSTISISVTKHPNIPGLSRGVRFTYQDGLST